MRRMLTVLLLLLTMAFPVYADDVCTVPDFTLAETIVTDCAYVVVCGPLTQETDVIVNVQDQWGTLLNRRIYGTRSGQFRSGEIHLDMAGDHTDFYITVETGYDAWTFIVRREKSMLTDSSVYAAGMSLNDMMNGSRRKFCVLLDMNALNQERLIVPMISGGMQIGTVRFDVLDGTVTVSAEMLTAGEILRSKVFVATDALTAQTFGSSHFTGTVYALNECISVGSTPYVALMVQLTAAYDGDGTYPWQPDAITVDEQLTLWQMMQMTTVNDTVG